MGDIDVFSPFQNPLFYCCLFLSFRENDPFECYIKSVDLNDIVANNLVELRKSKNLTQQEFAEAIGFSDKSISKWERGYAVPTVDILVKIAEFYDVTVNDLISPDAASKIASKEQEKGSFSRKVAICVLMVSVIWLIATLVFINGIIQEQADMWMAFLYAVPVSLLVVDVAVYYFWRRKSSLAQLIILSAFQWTLILTICVQMHLVRQPMWFLLIICIPLQVITILIYQIRKGNPKG